jgi:hypothetical protein
MLASAVITSAASDHAGAAEATRAVHGSADIFTAPGVTLAWGVVRGATEAATLVVVRITVNREAFGSASVVGIDPFTQKEQTLLPPTAMAPGIDVRVPRSQFADFPRTEFRLFASGPPAPNDAPRLVVYYLGVPDTTPEFASEQALETYLAARIAGAREGTGSKTP